MTPVFHRVRAGLRVALVLLCAALVAAVGGGVLARPAPAVGYAGVEGRALLRRSGTGPTITSAEPVAFRRHAIGVRCIGTGTLRVEVHPIGATETPCLTADTSDGGYVFSDIPTTTTSTRWQIRTRDGNRWSLVLTQPVLDGDTWKP